MKVEHKIDATDVQDLTDGTSRRRVRENSSKAIRDGLALLQLHHKRSVIRRGAGRSAAVPNVWSHRTGEASRSFHIAMQGGALQGAYGSELTRMRILELGGTITPHRGRFLAIPLAAARYGVGGGVGPRGHADLFVIRSKAGNLLLVRRKGKGIEPMFALKTSVKLPPRPTLQRTVNEKISDIDRLMLAAVVKATGRPDGTG